MRHMYIPMQIRMWRMNVLPRTRRSASLTAILFVVLVLILVGIVLLAVLLPRSSQRSVSGALLHVNATQGSHSNNDEGNVSSNDAEKSGTDGGKNDYFNMFRTGAGQQQLDGADGSNEEEYMFRGSNYRNGDGADDSYYNFTSPPAAGAEGGNGIYSEGDDTRSAGGVYYDFPPWKNGDYDEDYRNDTEFETGYNFYEDEHEEGYGYSDFEMSILGDDPYDPERADGQEEDSGDEVQHTHKKFKPLSCNNVTFDCSKPLSELVANAVANDDAEVIIPCGECAYWDVTDEDIVGSDKRQTVYDLEDRGLNVVGKLHVPSSASGTLRTTHVVIQGVLSIDPPGLYNRVVFRLHGGPTEQMFTPHEENLEVCSWVGGSSCNIGKKPIVIAGGTLDVRGIEGNVEENDDPDSEHYCPSWVKLGDILDENRTVVQFSVTTAAQCWDVGDEILFTSYHASAPVHEFITTIESKQVSVTGEQGYIFLAEALPKPFLAATERVTDDYAVEVARLNRRVVFEAERDDPESNEGLHGGHLIVLHTPHVAQRLEGVELRNFGQQGNLGRYPIHFHMCGSVLGSVVSRNVIRQSNQRGIVIHGTHDAVVQDNVAYDVFGHCFFTEDGIETGNVFRRNLGAGIKAPKFVIPGENDNFPAVFWITNPQNQWMDNVAAGSVFAGFWFDCRDKVRGPSFFGNEKYKPRIQPIDVFRDNVVHGAANRGITLYSPGWRPGIRSVLENTKVYRNKQSGFLTHGNVNVTISGGIIADNTRGLLNFRSSDTILENIRFVGYSENYATVRSLLTPTPRNCPWNTGHVYGMTLHTYRFYKQNSAWGIDARNLDFSRYGPETGCNMTGIIFSDEQIKSFSDTPNRFRRVKFDNDDPPRKISACKLNQWGVNNVLIEDARGDLGPTGNPGFLVSDSPTVTTFAGPSCVPMNNTCLAFCEGACLRQITLLTNNANSTRRLEMVLSNGTHDVTNRWHYYPRQKVPDDPYHGFRDGRFVATVPAIGGGEFYLSFRDAETRQPAWPDYIKRFDEQLPLCAATGSSQDVSTVYLVKPPPTWQRCPDLVKGGTFDDGRIDTWLNNKAIFNFTSPGANDSPFALQVGDQFESGDTRLIQNIDVSCLVSGRIYQFMAAIRLLSNDGVTPLSCTPGDDSDDYCPVAQLTLLRFNATTAKETTLNTLTLAETVGTPSLPDGWYRMQGKVTLSETDVTATKALIHVTKAKESYAIDDVSMKVSNSCPLNLCEQAICDECEAVGLSCCLDIENTGLTVGVKADVCPLAYCSCAFEA